jgi:hypothetical protein
LPAVGSVVIVYVAVVEYALTSVPFFVNW